MTQDPKNQGFVYNAFDLIQFAWNRKWILIGAALLAGVLSFIVSSFITPRFRSNVIMFPAASVSISKNLVETNVITSDTKDILTFGEDEEAEQLLQVLQSSKVREHIVEKFNLMDHYNIEPPYPYTKLNKKYQSNVNFRRTQYLSIEIDVLDEDPQMAADIANEIAAYVDTVFSQIKRARAQEAYSIVEKEYNQSTSTIRELTDSLKTIRSYGIHDYESQSEALNKAYAEALGEGRMGIVRTIEKQLDIMAQYGGIYIELDDKVEWEIERNSLLKAKLAAAKVNMESTMSNVFIVDRAEKSERKAVPKRSVVVMVTTVSTFILLLLVLLIIDNIKVRS